VDVRLQVSMTFLVGAALGYFAARQWLVRAQA
jgi:hypothetical protein